MESSGARQSTPNAQAPLRLVRDSSESLPDPLSSFIGRETELAEIADRLASNRLVTLTGAGGSGKTRLAIEAARHRNDYVSDGLCWVDLAPVEDPALVGAAVLSALGERVQANRAASNQLVATLADRELLLILDNCEHLVAECARLVTSLLRGVPRLRVLATSREALTVPGEVVWPVPTLPMTTAMQLFEERARAVAPAFRVDDSNREAVSEVCRRLDGLPLAIELAAARISALSPTQIAARLDDCFRLLGGTRRAALPHQQTLRATIEWSYALLPPSERVLLDRLSVFAGGCTLAAAEAVCADDDLPAADVLAHLCALVDRSLVISDSSSAETRYRLLETVRQYGAEQLEATGNADAVRRRHVEYFVRVAEASAAERFGAKRDWIAAGLQPEIDNVRVALRWSAEHESDLFVRLAFGLGWMYFATGLWWEGREWLERALAMPLGQRRDAGRAQALSDLAYLANHQMDMARSRPALEESLAIWDEIGNSRERSMTAIILSQSYVFGGPPEMLPTALRLAEESERTSRSLGHWLGTSWAALTLGGVYGALGDGDRAVAAYDEGRRLAYVAHEPMSVGIGCMGMASIALARGDLARAAALLREGLAGHRQAPEYMFLAWTIECTAMYAAARGRLADAARLLGGDQTLRRKGGATMGIEVTQREVYARIIEGARQALGDAAFEATMQEGRQLDMAGLIAFAEKVVAPDDENAVPTQVPSLRVTTLGAVRIDRDGVSVPLSEWKYAKARELLVLLLVHPQGRTREQIGIALWPEVSAEQLRSNLHPVLHHLRRVLGGNEWVMHEGGVYRFDRSRDYAFDAEEMERLVASASRANGDRESTAASIAAAVELYGGDFLEQDPPATDWHLERQDALRRLYHDTLSDLGRLWMELGLWREAEDVWRKVIARDDLNEAAYRELIRCHERLGDRREALRVYERLRTVLRDELDAEPDAETRSLVERLHGAPA